MIWCQKQNQQQEQQQTVSSGTQNLLKQAYEL